MSGAPRVAGIVIEAPGQRLEAVLEAVADQTVGVDALLAVCGEHTRARAERAGAEAVALPGGGRTAAGSHAGLKAALGGDHRWLWLLDGTALPRPDALEHLLEPAEAGGPLPAPALVASRVVLAGGELDVSAAPWPRVKPMELTIDAYQRGVVAIRTARHGSLLVARDAVALRGLPRVDYVAQGDDLEWTGRLLRDSFGLYAPASVVVRPRPHASGDQTLELRNRTAMMFGHAFDGRDKRWLALQLADRAVVEARSGRPLGALSALAKGIARGLRRQPAQTIPKPTED